MHGRRVPTNPFTVQEGAMERKKDDRLGSPGRLSRREFLQIMGYAAVGAAIPGTAFALTKLEPIGDPLKG